MRRLNLILPTPLTPREKPSGRSKSINKLNQQKASLRQTKTATLLTQMMKKIHQ
jgi:hypothetical protein